MGKLFDITDDIRQVVSDGFDDLIDIFGKVCLLVFPPTDTPAGVVVDPVGMKQPNRWVTGGAGHPDWSRDASGTVAVATTATVTLGINWRPRDRSLAVSGETLVEVGGQIEVKGYITDLQKVMAADHILVQSGLSSRLHMKFVRDGDAVDRGNIVQGRYFNLRLRRVQ